MAATECASGLPHVCSNPILLRYNLLISLIPEHSRRTERHHESRFLILVFAGVEVLTAWTWGAKFDYLPCTIEGSDES